MPENTGWQCLNMSDNTDSVWMCLSTLTVSEYVWEHRQCLNMSEDTDWLSEYIWEHRLAVSEYVWGHRLTASQTGSWGDSLGLKGHLHNWCTWQMCSWFVIAHRAKSLLYCYVGLFGRHLLLHLLVKSLSGHCYRMPTSCLLGCPSYQSVLTVRISHLFCLSSIIETWKCNSKFWRDK